MPFTVEEFRDLVRILEEKPEWRAELRRLVLTEELLSLLEQVAALRAETERRFQEMAATVDKLAREVARLGIGMGDLQRTQKRLIIDVADLKGDSLERRYRERAPAYFGGLIRRARALTTEDLDELLEPASISVASAMPRPTRRTGHPGEVAADGCQRRADHRSGELRRSLHLSAQLRRLAREHPRLGGRVRVGAAAVCS